MDYNLNFFPNNFDQNNFKNPYTPYGNIYGGNNYNQSLLDNKLKELQGIQQNLYQPQPNIQPNNKSYYLFCGDKADWDEFLYLNYGITEEDIFEDYKLFLQAKQELIEEQGKNRINSMKDKIANNKVVDSSIKSNVKPKQVQDNGTVGIDNNTINRDSIKPNNRPLASDKQQVK
jgi:hypothetical protein